MTRLIDADALIKEWYKINDINDEDMGARFVGYREIPRLINNAPTVFDIVRCEDCKQKHIGGSVTHYYWCDRWDMEVDDTDYCAWGERMEG